MTKFQEDLLNIRRSVIDTMRAQLMGPGSEVSYPDAEHELISEAPVDRYSVGILYPQNQKFGHNEYAGDPQATMSEDPDMPYSEDVGDEPDGRKSFSVYKEDSFDDEVNLAQQNKPSSMGLSFFVSGDLSSFVLSVQYAKYAPVKNDDIVIPYPGDSLYVPDCLTQYISFDEKTKTIKKLQSIKWKDLNDLFERNAIEDVELLYLIGNLNGIFKAGKTYRRCPFDEKISLQFDGNMAKSEVEKAKAYVTAVKHKVSDGIYGITVMFVNNENVGDGYIFQPKITVKSADLEEKKIIPYNSIHAEKISEEELSLEMLYRKKIVYGTGHGVAVDWSIDDGVGEIFTEYMPTYEVPKINLDLRKETSQEKAVKDRALSMKYLSDLDGTSKEEKISDMTSFIDCYETWIDGLETEMQAHDFEERHRSIAKKHISLCREAYARMAAGLDSQIKRHRMESVCFGESRHVYAADPW